MLNAGLTIALAAAAASVTEHPSTAAILTLGVTVGTWIINFVAAIHGGVWERGRLHADGDGRRVPARSGARSTSSSSRSSSSLAAWRSPPSGCGSASASRRVCESVALARRRGASLLFACTFVARELGHVREPRAIRSRKRTRRRSAIAAPLRIEAHLAPEDPRRVDLEHRALSKLRRVLPSVAGHYVSATSIGLFEQTAPHYGEIWYELGGRRKMSRVTTAEGVLETIYELAGVAPAERERTRSFAAIRWRSPPGARRSCSTASGRRSSPALARSVRRRSHERFDSHGWRSSSLAAALLASSASARRTSRST